MLEDTETVRQVLSVKEVVYLLMSESLAAIISLIYYIQSILQRCSVVTEHPRLTQLILMMRVPYLVIEIVFVDFETVAV